MLAVDNHNHNKVAYEQRALNIMLSKSQEFQGYRLESHRDRPDFIITNGIERVGVEHCCVDTICCKGKQHAQVTFSHLLNKRCPDSMHRLLDANRDVWVKYQQYIQEFRSDIFGLLFCKISSEHAYQAIGKETLDGRPKTDAYRASLDVNRLGLLCEVLIPDCDYMWSVVETNGRPHSQRIRGIPMTLLMAMTILMLGSTFDFVTFVVIPYQSHDYNVRTYTCRNIVYEHCFASFAIGCQNEVTVSAAFLDDKSK